MSDIDIRQLLLDAEDNANSGNYIESANLYKKVTIIDDNSSAAWYGLGVIHAKLGNFENSVNSFEQAHRINPDHGPTNANLALILEKSDSERAANFAKMALENIGENKVKKIPTVCGSLREAMESLDKDREFLTEGGVFTDDQIDAYIALKFEEIHKFEHAPHPVEFEMYYSS